MCILNTFHLLDKIVYLHYRTQHLVVKTLITGKCTLSSDSQHPYTYYTTGGATITFPQTTDNATTTSRPNTTTSLPESTVFNSSTETITTSTSGTTPEDNHSAGYSIFTSITCICTQKRRQSIKVNIFKL